MRAPCLTGEAVAQEWGVESLSQDSRATRQGVGAVWLAEGGRGGGKCDC